MIEMNKKMEGILQSVNDDFKSTAIISLNNLKEILLPKFAVVDGSILLKLDAGNNIPQKLDLEIIKRLYIDKTGYEASRNELRVNDYIKYVKNEVQVVLSFALQILECWSFKLKNDFPQYKFNLILSCDNENVTLRFHRKRNNEVDWLEKDLEGYGENAVLVKQI